MDQSFLLFSELQTSSGGDSDQPYIDTLVYNNGYESMRIMTGYTYEEFKSIWDQIGVDFDSKFVSGCGPKPVVTPKDAFFQLLNVLHLPTTCEKHGLDFGLRGGVVHKYIGRAIKIAALLLKEVYVFEDLTMTELMEKNLTVDLFPETIHMTGATLTMCNCPTGNHEEAKTFFSKKHGVYGMKVEITTYPDGRAAGWTKWYPGKTPDTTIF